MKFSKTLDHIDGGDEKQKFMEKIVGKIKGFENFNLNKINLKSGEISYDMCQITDDRVSYLLYNEEFVVASVMQIRTPSNKTTHNFFDNSEEFKEYILM